MWTPAALKSATAEALPARVGRIKRRKGEDAEAWRARAIDYVLTNPVKPEKKEKTSALADRFPETLQSAELHFQLSQDDLVRYARLAPEMPVSGEMFTDTERYQRLHGSARHNVRHIRHLMWEWVCQTFVLRSTEANCDLDCWNCPAGRLLACSAQNLTALEQDGIPASAVIKTPGDP